MMIIFKEQFTVRVGTSMRSAPCPPSHRPHWKWKPPLLLSCYLFYIFDLLVRFLLKKEFWCLKTKMKITNPESYSWYSFLSYFSVGRGGIQRARHSGYGLTGTCQQRQYILTRSHTGTPSPQPSGQRWLPGQDAFENCFSGFSLEVLE